MDFNDIFPEGLDFTEAYDLLEPVVIYILGMALYALFIFKFYRFVASKDIFELLLGLVDAPGNRLFCTAQNLGRLLMT